MLAADRKGRPGKLCQRLSCCLQTWAHLCHITAGDIAARVTGVSTKLNPCQTEQAEGGHYLS